VRIAFMKDEELVPALVAGKVDAITVFEPQTSQARHALGDRCAVLAASGLYHCTRFLVTRAGLLRERPQFAARLVTALLEAETFATDAPKQTSEIVAARLGLSPAEAATALRGLDLRVRLDQSLLCSLEDLARWAMREGLVRQAATPNYLSLLSCDALAARRPEAVTIIR